MLIFTTTYIGSIVNFTIAQTQSSIYKYIKFRISVYGGKVEIDSIN